MTRTRTTLRRCALVAALCLIGSGSAMAAKVLKFSHTDTAAGSRQMAAEFFAKKVGEYTEGRYEVQVFHSGQLGNDPKAIEQLRIGGIDFTVSSTGSYATHNKALNLTMMPFLVDTYEQGWKFYDESRWLQGEFGKMPAKGMRMLATWEAGFRSFTTKEPLNSPADAKDKKIRVFPNDMIRWIMESLGFNPVVLPITEVYLAIQQGAVIGQENPVDTIYSQRFYEVAPSITLTQHVYSPLPLAVSEMKWKTIPAADQQAIVRAAQEAATYSRQMVRASEDKQLAEMEGKGAKVHRPDVGPFRKAAEHAYGKAREQYGADVDAVLADAAAIRQAVPASK